MNGRPPQKRPDFFPPPVSFGPNDGERSRLDETISHGMAAAKGLFHFLTADSDESFAEQLDAKHGTRIVDTMKRYGMAKDVVSAPSADAALADPTPVQPSQVSAQHEPVDEDGEDVVLVIDEAPPQDCLFCKGRAVVSMNRATGTKIAISCPECHAAPKSIRARAQLPTSTGPRGAR